MSTHDGTSPVHPATRRQVLGILGFGVVVAGAYLVTSPTTMFTSAESMRLAPWLAVPVFLSLYLIRPFLAWPVSAISILLGYLYGPIALPLALAGTVLTTVPLYLLARYLDHDAGFLSRVGDAGMAVRRLTGDLRGVIAVRLAPLPIDAVSYTFGVAGVPMRPYLLGTAVGEVPWVVTAVMIGASASHLTAEGIDANPVLIVTTFSLASLLLVSRPAYRQLRRNVTEH